jgi:hypothetical protein
VEYLQRGDFFVLSDRVVALAAQISGQNRMGVDLLLAKHPPYELLFGSESQRR